METKQITTEMYEALKKPLPDEAVKPHPTKTFLSSIKAIYVTERFNDVFGCGAWGIRVEHVTTTEKSMVVVKVTFEVPEYGVYYESFGGNDNGGENSKNFDLGDAYKGATTDAITKIGSYLGVGIDVFKGKQTTPKNQGTTTNNQQTTTIAHQNDAEKKWLNKMDDGKNFTKEWLNVIEAINKKKITSIKEIEEHYKISKEVRETLQETLNYQEM